MEKIRVSVFIDRENKSIEVDLSKNSALRDLLIKINVNPVTVIVSRDNELILEEEKLNNNDELTLLSVISGG